TSVWPALVLLAVGVGMLVWAQSYSDTSARFPSLVSILLIVLALFDLWSRTRLPGQAAIAAFWGAGFGRREMNYDPPLSRQLAIIAWILACFAAMALVGLLASAPIFCAIFVRFRGGRPWREALSVGSVVVLFQFAVFEWLLEYELYRGLLFTRGGVAAW
ncbi:MAG: tripartite tricarboxylate transporter TctB family protein, partial [Paracoccaceae bacterium]|nr:tripartite tricarboxylate transporter TctB family protein [Paracoccaceae bacterium]